MFRRLAVLVFLVVASHADAQIRTQTRVNPLGFNPSGTNAQDGINVASRGNRFVAVWAEQGGTSQSTQDIYASVSNDDGLTWNTMTRVDVGDGPQSTDSENPHVVITDSGAIVVAWEERRGAQALGSTNQDVYVSRSTDGGATWSAAVPLNVATASTTSTDIDRIQLASSGDHVYATWEEDPACINCAENVYVCVSSNAGASFGPPILLNSVVPAVPPPTATAPQNDVDDPKIAASGPHVVVVWADDRAAFNVSDDVWASISHDFGTTWTEVMLETDPSGDVDTPTIATDGLVFSVVWKDKGVVAGGQVHGVVSTDGGITWSTESNLSPSISTNPAGQETDYIGTCVAGARVYVTYVSDHLNPTLGAGSAGARRAYVARSLDAGLTWQYEIQLDTTNPSRKNHFPQAVAFGETVYVKFETNNFGANDNAVAWSIDSGGTWQMIDFPVSTGDTDSPDHNEGPCFVASSTSNAAVWVYHDNVLGQNEVYACGIRVPYTTTVGAPTLGNSFNFAVRGVPLANPGTSFVTVISTTGTAPAFAIPDGRLLHVVPDALTLGILGDPLLLSLTSGLVLPSGAGDTPSIPFPLPSGSTLYLASAIFDPLGAIAAFTDPVVLVAQ